MVSSGEVLQDGNTLEEKLEKYNTEITGLKGSWKGNSYDNLSSKAGEFVGEYTGVISEQVSSFAEAVDLYEEYVKLKKQKKELESKLSGMDADDPDRATVIEEIERLEKEMKALKAEIEGILASITESLKAEGQSYSVSVPKGADVSGTAFSAPVSSSSSSSTSSKGLKDWTNDDNFVYYNQGGGWDDYRFSAGGSSSMASSGCGPTSMAMVMSSLGYDVTPNDTAEWSADHGGHVEGGTTDDFFTGYADAMGVNSQSLGTSSDSIRNALNNDELVILNVGPGDFTSSGHFVVARGYDESTNQVLIADPNRSENNDWWDFDRVVGQLRNGAWSYSVEKKYINGGIICQFLY